MKESAVILKDVSKTFTVLDHGAPFLKRVGTIISPSKNFSKVHALKKIDFEVKRGEFFGIVGRNGSGKSTLLKIIIGAIKPDKGGEVITNGKLIRLALGMGFDPKLSARDNIYLNGTILGLTFAEIGDKFDEIVGFAEIEEFIDVPIRFFSSGMKSRLAFSIAVYAQADIFLIDEFFGGVGDVNFRKKSELLFQEKIISNRTIIFVSHELAIVKKHCDRLLVINEGVGEIFEDVDEGLKYYRSTFKKKNEDK